MTLRFLTCTGQSFCRMTLNLGFSDVFLWLDAEIPRRWCVFLSVPHQEARLLCPVITVLFVINKSLWESLWDWAATLQLSIRTPRTALAPADDSHLSQSLLSPLPDAGFPMPSLSLRGFAGFLGSERTSLSSPVIYFLSVVWAHGPHSVGYDSCCRCLFWSSSFPGLGQWTSLRAMLTCFIAPLTLSHFLAQKEVPGSSCYVPCLSPKTSNFCKEETCLLHSRNCGKFHSEPDTCLLS